MEMGDLPNVERYAREVVVSDLPTDVLRAELRRRQPILDGNDDVIVLPGLRVNADVGEVVWRGKTTWLTGRSLELLVLVARGTVEGRRLINRKRVAAIIWRGWDEQARRESMAVTLTCLRRRLPGLIGGSGLHAIPARGRMSGALWLDLEESWLGVEDPEYARMA